MGEDFLVRIFHNGNPTGHDFYIQLKGTKKVAAYRLKSGDLSCPIEALTLEQWYRFPLPVVLVLWDIEKRVGYWQHVQPFVEKCLKKEPRWLSDPGAVRRVRIPSSQELQLGELNTLKETIETEFAKLARASKSLDVVQEATLAKVRQALESRISEEAIESRLQHAPPLQPQLEQQLLIAQSQSAVLANPADVKAWLGLARIYYNLNDLDKALAAINSAWELDTRDPNIINARGSILCEYASANDGPKSMLLEAIELFTSIRSAAKFPSVIDYNIGNCLASLGDHQVAVQHFDAAIELNPPPELVAQIWTNRGRSFYRLGNRQEAIKSYMRAVHIEPTRWEAYSSWAFAELKQGHYADARSLLLECFKANPKIEKGGSAQLYWLAYALWKLEDLRAAHERVTALLTLKPNHHDGRLLKSYILSKLWRTDGQFIPDALTFFKSRIVDDSHDMFARGELYLIYASANYKREARLLLEETVASSTAPPRALCQYANLLVDEGELQKADDYLELAYKQDKGHHVVHNLARVKQKLGQYRDAVEFYMRALEGVKNPVAILRSIADCYHFLGDYKQCIQFETKALLLEPRNEILWSNVQYSLVQLGNQDLFSSFMVLRDKLGAGEKVTNSQVIAAQQELLTKLRVAFGDEFAKQVISNQPLRNA